MSNDPDTFVLAVAPAPTDTRGRVLDSDDGWTCAALLDRAAALDPAAIDAVLAAAEATGTLSDAADGRVLLHRAIETVTGFNRLAVTLTLDGRPFLVSGGPRWELEDNDEPALVAALGASGITSAPLGDGEHEPAAPTPAEDLRPISSWLVGLVLDRHGPGIDAGIIERLVEIRQEGVGDDELLTSLAPLFDRS